MFIEPRFLFVAALCWITFSVVPARFRAHLLVGCSLLFYALYAPRAVGIVLAVTLLAFIAADLRQKWVTIAIVVGLVLYFKSPIGAAPGAPTDMLDGASPFVPLGFSYLALELIHHAIERARGRIRGGSIVDLAAFTLFFPCRVAGPIKRYNDFTASVAGSAGSARDVYHGCLRILSGLVKKAVLANALTRPAGLTLTATTAADAWGSMIAYALWLYLDFSAYSDFAIGVSRLMGIRVPENFNWPYFASNIQEFWNRWHMSLSSWVRDYVFTNLGRQLFKTRLKARPGVIAATGYFATFLVVGAWHGLAPHFLVWGAYHGVLVTATHFYKAWLPDRVIESRFYQSRVVSWAGMAFTFVLVTIGLVFFRMDLPNAARVLRLMFTNMA